MLNIDLHCHSTVSDGVLTPAQLVQRASQRGVKVLALTDHDDVAGLDEACMTAAEENITFINGVEISVSWRGRTIHVLGLNIDPNYQPLFDGLAAIRDGRTQRARNIAAELEKVGIDGSFEGAFAHVGARGLIGRTHFARFLIENGYARDMKSVFKKYLVKGKPGYAHHEWAALSEAVNWITGSGGNAVIAHPARYNLGKNVLNDLLDDFCALGGTGLEVISASHTQQQVEIFAGHARMRKLLVSCGSDFHGPDESFYDLGKLPELPAGCVPVWHDWKVPENAAAS
ncbi:MAG TPA: 3',5'-nucleoside bisphosphate phosphatase [Nitrosomonas sp.]|uniref:3',5'-nucleoside bisphosphate phosphatase n=1 Tax=Nitrosomonas sp. TaxID=42353 RepID=UPI000E9C9D09|nr:3',5'-nucleoside bisphosphate phosphatase [Nitrosomonas sp.]GJL75027.1 MAG: phosphatase [Nitrosomonas sp.]HBV21771.1 phosphatase [Nitrosomonas sp.]HNP27011.1 3',5'-nucleoside bisphosphate phosphatase [Nitrosomonas sp.]